MSKKHRRGPAPTWSGDERTYNHSRTFQGERVEAQDSRGANISGPPSRTPVVKLPTDLELDNYTRIRQERVQL